MSEFDYLDYRLNEGYWQVLMDDHIPFPETGESIPDWRPCGIIEVPVEHLLKEYEGLVLELSELEVELYNLKEAYLLAERKIIEETDFKALYGANNEKVRKQHVKSKLSDMVQDKASLQFSIDFIKNYIPLLREVIQVKKE